MVNLLRKNGFTLIEVLVAVSLFAIVGMLTLTVFINITRIQGRLNLENAIYEDARFMLERISREIRNNAIDYEEYYNKALPGDLEYGKVYGCYAAQFYNPGQGNYITPNLTDTVGTLGAQCSDDGTSNAKSLYTGQDCVVFKPSIDLNTGVYPYKGASVMPLVESNAFCPNYPGNGSICTPNPSNLRHELYLIDKSGQVETIFARKKVASAPSDQYALAVVNKIGEDSNNDGVTEKWNGCTNNIFCCSKEYDCPATKVLGGLQKLEESLLFDNGGSGIYVGFIPLSPLRSDVTQLDFQIVPGNDPQKAFADANSVFQPMVRVTLKVQPSADQLARYGNQTDIPTIVLQTTISSRIQSEVKSYLGPDSEGLKAAGCNLTSS